MLERIWPRSSSPRSTTDAAVSSQVVSMPRTNISTPNLILTGPTDLGFTRDRPFDAQVGNSRLAGAVSKDDDTFVASSFETHATRASQMRRQENTALSRHLQGAYDRARPRV